MKINRSSSKSGLFLIELIIAITFFSVASAICVQLFTQAHLISTKSRDLDNAMGLAQICAEEFKAMSGTERQSLNAETLLYYDIDDDGELYPVENEAATKANYCVRIRYNNEEDGLSRADIAVALPDNDDPLYEIEVSSYEI